MSRTSWRVLWAIIALMALAGGASSVPHTRDLPPQQWIFSVMVGATFNASLPLLLLPPLFWLGAALRARRIGGRARYEASSEELRREPQAMAGQSRATNEAPPPAAGVVERVPVWHALAVWLGVIALNIIVLQACASRVQRGSRAPVTVAGPIGSGGDALTVDEKLELDRLFQSVLQDPDTVTQAKVRFWEIADSHGRMTDEELADMRKAMLSDTEVVRLFWEDVLLTLQRGRPFKSIEREQLEDELVKQGKMTAFQRRQNEATMESIASGKPIAIQGGNQVVVTEQLARSVLEDFDRKREALVELLTPPAE